MEEGSMIPINTYKVANLAVGAISLVIGLYSHFQSFWVKRGLWVFSTVMPVYRACDFENMFDGDGSCPSIALEQFYVSVIIICFVLSFITFLLGLGVDLRKEPYRKVDLYYHVISALALVVAGSLYIISTVQIYNIFDLGSKDDSDDLIVYRFRTYEKCGASAVAFLQGIQYACTAFSLRG